MAQAVPLEVTGLSKKYQKGLLSFSAVSGVSFSIKEGEILGFLGPNGAGKTTAIKCILGLLTPTSGEISLWGEPPASAQVRRRLGYVPENPDYEDVFTPMEFLGLVSGMRNMSQSRSEMKALLHRVGLSGWETTRLRRFSKGMKQKFSLAMALQFSPQLIIMDEPTGGLDPTARKEFRDIILEENARGATIFLSSHLLSEVETVCDRAIILSHGQVVREGSMDELRRTEHQYRISWLPADAGDCPESVEERIVHEKDLQSTIDSLRSSGCRITSLREIYRSLEEVFLESYRGEGPMRSVMSFALMTVKSLLRRRTIYGIGILLLLALLGIGQVPDFNVRSQGRFILDFGLFGIELGGLLLAIGLAANLYPRDRERKTVMPLVAVPLSRTKYLLGRFTGAALVQAVTLITGLLGLMLILILNGLPIPSTLPWAGLLLIVEGWFLLSVVFFFSFWTSPPLNAPLTIILFILSQMSVRDFVGLVPSMAGVMRVVRMLLPHMDVFHIKDPVAHGIAVEPVYFLLAILYGLAYTSFMLSVALAVWRSRDLK